MKIVDSYGALLIDMDGVLYLHDTAIKGAREAARRIQEHGIPFLFLTNNSAETRGDYASKLSRLRVIDVDPGLILTTSQAVSSYIERELPRVTRAAFVIGGDGIVSELAERGFELLEGEEAKEAPLVIAGWDMGFDFEKLKIATLACSRGAHFIVTDRDPTYPSREGPWPGTGALVAAIQAASGATPVVVGKPECFYTELALETLDVSCSETLFVGDRLDSDVQAGINADTDTMLVLTGIATEEELKSSDIEPTYVKESIGGLFDEIP